MYPMSRVKQLVVVLLLCIANGITAQAAEQTGNAGAAEVLNAPPANPDPEEWVTEKTGQYLPLDTNFVDENGKSVTLGSFIDRPTLILPIYFFCPNVCSKNLANMAVAMNRLSFEPGRDYKAIALSFSDTENADIALRAKRNYMKLVYDGFPVEDWTFLTGSRESIATVTDALGYRFKRVSDETFIHPSALIAVAGDGKIIRYVYGSFVPGDVDMAISSAREGTPVLSVKRLLGFCFNYDPAKNTPIVVYVKIAVLAFFSIGLAVIFYMSRKKRKSGKSDDNTSSYEQDETT